MEVDASCGSSRHYPQEIDQLLEAFGTTFSIDYIASTFFQANNDIDIAGEILCELQASAASTAPHQPMDKTDMSSKVCTGTCNSSGSELHPCSDEGQTKELDMGKDYTRPGTSKSVQFSSGTVTTETTHKDVDEFLFEMLGDGFQLDMNMIQEVLSACGYDMQKSIETLLDISTPTLRKSDDILSKAPEAVSDFEGLILKRPSKSYEEMLDPSCQGKTQHGNSVRSSKKNKKKAKSDIEKEMLQSLFTSKEPEEEPEKSHLRKALGSSGRFGKVVTQPLKDTPILQQTLYVTSLQPPKDVEDEDDDSFHVFQKAAIEHRATMKEYYKAAGEAYLKHDHARSKRLMEKGEFFNLKAREADEKSLQKLVETGHGEDEVLFDFSNLEPRESVQRLRSQLVILCGISYIPHIKVKVRNDEGGPKDASRKRMILKLLEKESIKWTEMENGKLIVIQADKIDPESLSFFTSPS